MTMKLAWLGNTWPDFLFDISQLAQATDERFTNRKKYIIKPINRAVKFACWILCLVICKQSRLLNTDWIHLFHCGSWRCGCSHNLQILQVEENFEITNGKVSCGLQRLSRCHIHING